MITNSASAIKLHGCFKIRADMTERTQSVPSIFPQVLDGDRKPHLCI